MVSGVPSMVAGLSVHGTCHACAQAGIACSLSVLVSTSPFTRGAGRHGHAVLRHACSGNMHTTEDMKTGDHHRARLAVQSRSS